MTDKVFVDHWGTYITTPTRSAFAGQQRYASATWSGDISSTWTAMRKQLPAGLGFSLSGIPYWSMDTGGFSVPARFSRLDQTPEAAEEWRELNARWFQFATFVPLTRVHGEFPNREMWFFGGESHPAYQTMLKFDRLRYRLLPYIYSLAGAVTQNDSTIMRPLVMDFRADAKARVIGDEYMFGQAFLVTPVMTYMARHRQVYLPQAASWYDFWTGAEFAGGQTIDAPAPYDSIPLHVYAGADGAFTLYEDEGINYNYERGAFSRIALAWNNAARMLTLGKREGSFQGMLNERTFNIVLVSKAKPNGFSFAPQVEHKVRYLGDTMKVKLEK